MEGKDCAPTQDVEGKVFGNRNLLDDPICWVLDNEYSNVDTGCKPRILCILKIEIVCVNIYV
jgi:hypothetical protein